MEIKPESVLFIVTLSLYLVEDTCIRVLKTVPILLVNLDSMCKEIYF